MLLKHLGPYSPNHQFFLHFNSLVCRLLFVFLMPYYLQVSLTGCQLISIKTLLRNMKYSKIHGSVYGRIPQIYMKNPKHGSPLSIQGRQGCESVGISNRFLTKLAAQVLGSCKGLDGKELTSVQPC